MKFVCHNPECAKNGVFDECFTSTYKFVNGKLMNTQSPCPICGEIREEINENIPLSEKNIEIAKYTSGSAEHRREVLKKRSKEHFKKHIKPFKEHKINEAVTNFKNAGK